MTSETYDDLLMEQMTWEGGDQVQSRRNRPTEPVKVFASPMITREAEAGLGLSRAANKEEQWTD